MINITYAKIKSRKLQSTAILAWLIPSIIFWLGVYIFSCEYISQKNKEIISSTESELISKSYDYSIEHYFHPRLKKLFSQFKGMRSGAISAQERIISDFKKQWNSDSIEIYVFDGTGKISKTKDAKPEHELFFNVLTNEMSNEEAIKIQDKLGKVFPAPYVMINRAINRIDTVVSLANPDKYSYCYFNIDKTIKDNIAGILIFIHKKNLNIFNLLKTITDDSKSDSLGFIYKNEPYLPNIIKSVDTHDLKAYDLQYPVNSIELSNKIICLNKLTDDILLINANPAASLPYSILSAIVLVYLISSLIYIKIIYEASAKRRIYKRGMLQKITAILILCYAMPTICTAFMLIQYLGKLDHALLQEELNLSRKKLSEIDCGFNGYLTSKLLKQRNFTNELQNNVTNKTKLIDLLDNFYYSNYCDSIHMLSSTSELLYTTKLLGVEARRYRNAPQKLKEQVIDSWETRKPAIITDYRDAINGKATFGNIANVPIEEIDDANKSCRRLFTSGSLNAMEFYNELNEISSPIKRDATTMFVDSIIENTTQSFFMSATTNLGQFTSVVGIEETILGFVDVLYSPYNKEAWYCYASLVDLSVFEREYLENFYNRQKSSLQATNDKIIAISDHFITQNFPSLDEYKTYDSIIKRSKNETGAFVHKMKLNGEDKLINVLKCSNMNHYILLHIIDLNKIEKQHNSKLLYAVVIIFIYIISGTVIAILLSKSILRPINDLSNGMDAFSNKDYNYQIPIRLNDEFGELAQACNNAAKTLSQETISQDLKNLFPQQTMNFGTYLIETANCSSRPIANDFYDFLPLIQGTYAFIIAEISGNDLHAAHLIAEIKTIFNMLTPAFSENPEIVLERLNSEFIEESKNNRLITCLIGIIDPTNETAKIANAGQSAPLIYDNDSKECAYLNIPSIPLGIQRKDKIKQHKINLENKTMVLYSSEALNLTDKNGNKLDYEPLKEIIKNELDRIIAKKEKCNISQAILDKLEESSIKVPLQKDITIIDLKTRL